jgi:hypothetical protein
MRGQPTGEPSRKWMEEIPNNGLIRHYLMLNVERILVISPKGLSELLTQKAYDFEKPSDTAYFLTLLLGDGLLTAEGDKHKVRIFFFFNRQWLNANGRFNRFNDET